MKKSLLKYFSENRSGDNFTDSLDNLVSVARRNAQQKAEDEKILQEQITENKRLLEEISRLKKLQSQEKTHC